MACAPAPEPSATPDASIAKPSPSPSPAPSAAAPPRTLGGSVERAVAEHEQAQTPCGSADKAGVPCFPTSVDATGPRYSVADSIRAMRFETRAEPQTLGTIRLGPSAGVSFDPVCAVKRLGKAIKGRNDTYYLYRVWDRVGPYVVLREKPFDAAAFQGVAEAHYELLGEYHGECSAISAYRSAVRADQPALQWPEKQPAPEPSPSSSPN